MKNFFFTAIIFLLSVSSFTVQAQNCSAPAAPYVNWSGCNKSDANLTSTNLSGANLSGANLSGAMLSNSDLTNANLSGANLTYARLNMTNLTNTNLSGATLTGVESGLCSGTPAALPAGWQLNSGYLVGPGANLTGASLNGQNLSGANLSDANLFNSNLSGANLSGANLSFANLSFANLSFANLTGVVSGGIIGTPSALPVGWQLVNGYLVPPPTITATQSQVNTSCNGGCNGSATVVASGGAAPYTYSWSPSGGTAATASGLCAGTYTCTITDGASSTITKTFSITQPSAIVVSAASQTNVSCNGGSNGAASINTPTGGTPGYTYDWTPGVPTGDGTRSVTGLSAGTWTCTVTDINGCTKTQTFTITQPSAILLSAVSQTNVSCNGGSNGSASVTLSGGAGGYTYYWSPSGGTAATATGLSAGTWTCYVTDSEGCTKTVNFTVTQPSAIVVSAASQTNVSCNGGSNGAASINTPTGGTPGYTYDWTPGVPTGDGTRSVTGLTAGTWTCTVTDNNGCTKTQTFTITQPSAIVVSAASQTDASCPDGSSGTASINTPTGGTPGYTYNWTPGNPTGDGTRSVTGLTAGTWTCTVTDGNSCTASLNFDITRYYSPLTVSAASQTNVSCNGGSNGAASVNATGGASPRNYDWTPGAPTGDGTGSVTGLWAGTWTCTVTDSEGCTKTVNFNVTQPSAIVVSAASQTNVSCNGGSNGAASINTPTGGTPGYTYNWSPGNPTGNGTPSVTGLSAGTWRCDVTDSNGCIGTTTVLIATLNTSSTPITAVSVPSSNCPNTDVTLTASGGISGTGSIIKWYSGPNGTGTLLGTGNSIIVSPTETSTYYVRREGLCNTTADFSVVVNVKSFSYAANGTSSSNYCTDNSGWNHFYVGDEIILSVQGNLSNAGTITATIQDNNAYYFSPGSSGTTSCSCPVELGEAQFEMERNWNLNLGGGTLSGTYSVRFYYEPSEKTAVINAAAAWITANPACGYTYKYNPLAQGWFWFKNQGSPYSAPDYDDDPTFLMLTSAGNGTTPNGINYSTLSGITSFSGGSGAIILVPDPLLPIPTQATEPIVACGSYEWHGNTYTASNNTATWVGTNAAGCDSIVTLNLTINQPSYSTEPIVACGSYEWHGNTYTASNNTATWTGTNAAGCDSTVTLNLTINQPSNATETIAACGSYEWYGTIYTESNNTATWTGTNAAGCDSIVTLNLTIDTLPTITCTDNIIVNNDHGLCGALVTFADAMASGSSTPAVTYTHASGSLFPVGTTTVIATTTNSCGVDSCSFTVTVNDVQSPSFVGPEQWASSVLEFSSEYSTEYAGANNWWDADQALGYPNVYPQYGDKILTWAPFSEDSEREFISLGYNTPMYVSAIDIYETYNPGAIDSISLRNASTGLWYQVWTGTAEPYSPINTARIFTVTIPSTSYLVDAVRIALNSPAVPGWNEIDAVALKGSLIEHITAVATQSCTAAISITEPTATDNCSINLVSGVRSDGLALNASYPSGVTTISWTASDIHGNVNNPFVQTITVTGGFASTATETITACGSYEWHGNTYTSSNNTATWTGQNATGCDSIVTLNLTINQPSYSTETIAACGSYEWHGNTYTSSNNTATWTGTNVAGCDSIVTLDLTINQPSYTTEPIVACGSYEWHGNTYTSSNNTATWTGQNAAGCDSIVTLNLTINQPSYSTEPIVACGSYEWHGNTYTASNNTATWTGTNAAGCDSIVTLNLTINQPSYTTETIVACGSYAWHGNTYTSSNNTATWTGTNAAGCDSTVTLNLTINQPSYTTETIVACGYYEWHGTTYTSSTNNNIGGLIFGAPTWTGTNAAGCDSTVTLNLTINQPSYSTEPIVACGSYEWHGNTYTASNNTATWTGTNAAGCDSIVTLNLTINTIPTITCPSNITVDNDPGICGAVVSFGSATTIGSPAPVLTYSHASGSLFPIGTTTVTATATNICGAQSCSFTVTVNDHEAPVINVTPYVPSQVTLNMADRMITYTGVSINGSGNSKTVLPGSTVNIAYAMSVSFNYLTGYCPSCFAQSYIGIGGTNQALQCEDRIDNGYSRNRNVNFTAPTAPGIYYITQGGSLALGCVPVSFNNVSSNAIGAIVVGSCPEILVNSTSNQAGTNVTFATTTADCNPVVLTYSNESGSFFPIGSTQVTVTAEDSYNNTSSCTFMVTVADATPTIICPADITANNCGIVTFAATAQALGAIPGTQTLISYSPASGSYFPIGTTTVTATATNEGGTATCTFNVNMVDNEKPVFGLNNYIFSTSENTPLEDLSLGAVTLFGPNTDDVSSTIPLPFDFIFNNVNRTQTIISSNGLMSFENSRSESIFIQGNIANSVMPLWGDLYTGTNGGARYKVLGNSPLRKFVVEWNVQMCCSNAPADKKFQVWLFEGTNTIQIVYGAGTNITPFDYSPGGTIGLSGAGVTDFNLVTTSSHTSSSVTTNYANITWPGAGRSYTFSTPRDRYTAAANAGCGATINVDGIQFADACGIDHTDAMRSDGLSLNSPYPVGETTVSWTATDFGGNVSDPFVQTVTVTGVSSAASPAAQSICSGDTIANVVLSGGLEGTTFTWTRNGSVSGIPSSGSGNISGSMSTTGAAQDVTFTITPNYNGCAGTPFTAVVTVNAKPQPVISGALEFCAGSSTTLDAGAGYSSYLWSTGETTQTISVSNTTPVSVAVTNAAGCSATSASVTPTANAVSTAPTSITSSVAFATVGVNFTLSVNGGSLGTGATWKWYTGSCGGTLIGTGASIGISQSANTTYFVRAEGTCNTTACATITVNSQCGATGVTSSAGTTAICAGSPVTLTVIGSLSPGAQWRWDDECENDDDDHDCSYNSSSTFTVSPTSTKTYYVRSVGGLCGLTACVPITVTVIAKPATPGTINGSASVCPSTSVTYTIAAVAGATSYTWTAPTNATLVSAQGGTSMTVAYAGTFTSGTLKVKANNCSGSSSDRTKSIAKQAAPATPASISGASAPCKGSTQTYSTIAVSGATSYTWTLPTGVSFVSGTPQTGTSIQVVVANTFSCGTLSVKANNCGGSSSNRTKALTGQSTPTAPGTISGPNSVTQNTANNTFSVSNVAGMTYNWTVPAGCTITLGQGTNTIKVTWGTLAGTVNVTRNNGCGNSVASTKSVSVKRSEEAEADAGMEGARTEETVETLLTQTDALNAIAVYPNPTTGEARITFSATAAGNYSLSIVDLQGRVIISTSGAAIEGNNTLDINLSNCSNGVYMIHLMHNDSLQTLRVVKM